MVTDLTSEEAGRTQAARLPETASQDASIGAVASDEVDRKASESPTLATRRRAMSLLAAVAVAALVIDVVTKQLVVAHLREGEPVRVLGGLFYFTLIRNGGAAFSMGTSHTWVFPLVTVVVVGWIAWMSSKLRSLPWAVALGLVLGGALGNLGDRLFRAPGPLEGHVVDFISFLSPDGSHFAIFNAADSALTCGVILALVLEVMGRRRDGSRAHQHES